MTNVVFLGTPEAAIPTLTEIHETTGVSLVVTQPDRPKGRGGRLSPPPVKTAAIQLDLPVTQPKTATELEQLLHDRGPFDLGIVVAYGRILSAGILAIPRMGFLNLHFSLLPRWRGAAPVERAIMADDPMTGVTIISIDEGLDTGPVLTAQALDIGPDVPGGELTNSLASIGGRLMAASLPAYLEGSLVPEPQVEEGAVYANKLTASDRKIVLEEPRLTTRNRVRALSPTPGATLVLDGETYKLLEVSPSDVSPEVGTWVVDSGLPVLGCADGGLELVVLQPPGKTPRSGGDWVRGLRRPGGMAS